MRDGARGNAYLAEVRSDAKIKITVKITSTKIDRYLYTKFCSSQVTNCSDSEQKLLNVVLMTSISLQAHSS